MTYRIVNPSELGSPRGWNNGMLAHSGGRILFVAGQIGVADGAAEPAAGADPNKPATLAAQFGVALSRVAAVVQGAGGTVADVGRLTIYVTDMDAYRASLREVGAAYRQVFGRHFPAMALVAASELVDPRALVEVEATAVIPQAQRHEAPAGGGAHAQEQP